MARQLPALLLACGLLLCTASRVHVFNKQERLGMQDSWGQRIQKCAEDGSSPWRGVKEAAQEAGISNAALGLLIVNQVQERISGQGLSINQGWEGLCSVVASIYVLALSDPNRFAELVADLFCKGTAAKGGATGLGKTTTPSTAVLNCKTTAKAERTRTGDAEEGENPALFYMQNRTNDKIRVVDWICAASFADAYNKRTPDPCQPKGQGQGTETYVKIAKVIFPRRKVDAAATTGGFSNLFKTAQHLERDQWAEVLRTVKQGGQVLLAVDTEGGSKTMKRYSGHLAVLTAVLDETYVDDKCAKELLRAEPACVVWTWAQYYVFESCDNLRKITDEKVSIANEQNTFQGSPTVYRPGGALLPHFVKALKKSWFVRRQHQWPNDLTKDKLDFQSRSFSAGEKASLVPRIRIGSKQKKAKFFDEAYRSCLAGPFATGNEPFAPGAEVVATRDIVYTDGTMGAAKGHRGKTFAYYGTSVWVKWEGADESLVRESSLKLA